MNKNQIKQRLLEAALTDDIPTTPHFRSPQTEHSSRATWARYGIAACIIGAIASLPLFLHQSPQTSVTETLLSSDDPAIELECAFAMINQHFTASDNLIDIVQ